MNEEYTNLSGTIFTRNAGLPAWEVNVPTSNIPITFYRDILRGSDYLPAEPERIHGFLDGELVEFSGAVDMRARPGARGRIDFSLTTRDSPYIGIRWIRSDRRVRQQADGGYRPEHLHSLCPRRTA